MKLLDCTLRDGSYVHKFSPAENFRIAQLLDESGIDYIEVGNGTGMGVYPDDEKYMEAASQAVKKAKWGMFCIPGIGSIEDVRRGAAHGMGFIRVGTNVDKYYGGREFIEEAKSLGLYVAANFMKSYARPIEEFANAAEHAAEYGADAIYIVDSAGNMTPDEIEQYMWACGLKEIGFHGHNNLGLANGNALEAKLLGADIIDCSLQGIGRCTGNTVTEQFVAILQKMEEGKHYDLFKLMDTGEEFIRPLLGQSGLASLDLVCGLAGFHSSFLDLVTEIAGIYDIDPRRLVIEVCKKTQSEAPETLVREVAHALAA